MDSFWWYLIGAVAAFFGFANLENAKRQRGLTPLTTLLTIGAAYLLVRNVWLLEYGDEEQLVGLALVFCAISPLLGWMWWGRDGAILRGLGRGVLFVVIWAVSTVVWSLLVPNPLVALLLGAATAVIPFRWKRWRAKAQQRKHAKEWARDRKRQEKQQMREEQQQRELERKQREVLDALIDELRR